MCGKETVLFKTNVEGSILNLCKECSKFGKVVSVVKEKEVRVRKPASNSLSRAKTKEQESILVIVPGYGDIIKKKREQLGIKQEDFAKKINEKKALIHKIEINQFEPSVDLARKIEKSLHIKLIEQQELKPEKVEKTKSDSFTIGDFIKVKR
jgi:putative transcription factor